MSVKEWHPHSGAGGLGGAGGGGEGLGGAGGGDGGGGGLGGGDGLQNSHGAGTRASAPSAGWAQRDAAAPHVHSRHCCVPPSTVVLCMLFTNTASCSAAPQPALQSHPRHLTVQEGRAGLAACCRCNQSSAPAAGCGPYAGQPRPVQCHAQGQQFPGGRRPGQRPSASGAKERWGARASR